MTLKQVIRDLFVGEGATDKVVDHRHPDHGKNVVVVHAASINGAEKLVSYVEHMLPSVKVTRSVDNGIQVFHPTSHQFLDIEITN